jgi:tRNA(fMet)-specific endonuclease VapC
MTGVLVDTDVISYVFKGDTRADLYRKHLDGQRLHVSFATVAELCRWAVQRQWGAKRVTELQGLLRGCVVLGTDDPTAWKWAEVMSIPGCPITPGDAWVAAAALRHHLPLVTHNRKHFEHIPGLTVASEA